MMMVCSDVAAVSVEMKAEEVGQSRTGTLAITNLVRELNMGSLPQGNTVPTNRRFNNLGVNPLNNLGGGEKNACENSSCEYVWQQNERDSRDGAGVWRMASTMSCM